MLNSSDILKQQLFKSLGMPWQDLMPASFMERMIDEEGIRYRKRVYTPIVTLWGMLYQVLCVDGSLRDKERANHVLNLFSDGGQVFSFSAFELDTVAPAVAFRED